MGEASSIKHKDAIGISFFLSFFFSLSLSLSLSLLFSFYRLLSLAAVVAGFDSCVFGVMVVALACCCWLALILFGTGRVPWASALSEESEV